MVLRLAENNNLETKMTFKISNLSGMEKMHLLEAMCFCFICLVRGKDMMANEIMYSLGDAAFSTCGKQLNGFS